MTFSKRSNIFYPPINKKTLTGIVERITYQNEENNYVVARFRIEDPAKNLITVVGSLPSIFEGERLELDGEWQKHSKFGYQFKVSKVTNVHPVTEKGIELYLGSGLIKGIGKVYAKKIVTHFGLDTMGILNENSDRLKEVEGIGKKRLGIIKTAWQSHTEIRGIMIFLAEHNISSTYAIKIFKNYGAQTLKVLRKNPYQLADDIIGIGFLTADKIAKNIGISEDEPARIEAGIKYSLTKAADQGHLFLPQDELFKLSAEILKISPSMIKNICNKLIKINHLVNDNGAIYLAALYNAEIGLCERLLQLKTAPGLKINSLSVLTETGPKRVLQGINYNHKQKLALSKAVEEKILVLAGGPGTGKTTIIKGIIQIFEHLSQKICLTAPTGRGAKRMAEMTKREAKTIHRLLEFEPKQNVFKRNLKNPVKADVFIVDEMSMVDCTLALHLVNAIPRDARLIIVGDVDQLPSVGAGNVLRDIIDSGIVATIIFDEIFRQAVNSRIIINAHKINRGLMPSLDHRDVQVRKNNSISSDRLLPLEDFGDFLFVQEEDPEKIVRTIRELCQTKLPQRYKYFPKRDIQILTPMYRGDLGADNLNKVLQESLNPGQKKMTRGQTEFRVGDRVMQKRNDYDKRVFNGDLGVISLIDLEEQKMVVTFEKKITYEFSELDQLVLAYAITVHKSQGSEYPVVIMPITTQHYMMLQRNLLYTAITRAKELIILIGTKKALAMAVKNNRVVQRYTQLARRLRKSGQQSALKIKN